MTETLGQRIAQRRRMLSLSQEALGERMGVSRQAISKWESDAAIPEVDRLIEMSRLFDVSVGWLLGTEQHDEEALDAPFLPIMPVTPTPQTRSAPQEPESNPEPEQLPHQPLAWLSIVCSIVAVVSLALSVFTFWQVGRQKDTTPMPQSYDDLLAKIAAFQEDLDYNEKRNEQIYASNIEAKVKIWENSDLIEGLTSYIYAMPNASGMVGGPDKLEQFESWNIVGSANEDCTSVEVMFSCIPAPEREVMYAIMEVFLGEESVVQIPCYSNEETYTHYCEIQLEPKNGYRYQVELYYKDNSSEIVELTGHKMSNLLEGVMPKLEATRVSDSDNAAAGSINVAYSEIRLGWPALVSSMHNSWRFVTLRLAHYQDGELKASHDLSELLQTLYQREHELVFSVADKTFSTVDTKDGSVHEIRLEGEADLDWSVEGVQSYPYSVVLETWENTEGWLSLVE